MRTLALLVSLTLVSAGFIAAPSAVATEPASVHRTSAVVTDAQDDIHDQIDSELEYLATLPEAELEQELASLNQNDGTSFRVAPLVIVGAIGCAVFTKSWENPNIAVWALAGVLTGCIPGTQQAKLVQVIIKNKHIIATALKKAGAHTLASAILAANIAPVAVNDR